MSVGWFLSISKSYWICESYSTALYDKFHVNFYFRVDESVPYNKVAAVLQKR